MAILDEFDALHDLANIWLDAANLERLVSLERSELERAADAAEMALDDAARSARERGAVDREQIIVGAQYRADWGLAMEASRAVYETAAASPVRDDRATAHLLWAAIGSAGAALRWQAGPHSTATAVREAVARAITAAASAA